ncbi:hypothetical protein NFI96_009065 [Prochilodus magdalenae]|nr:hypothetical protein NFI96_009065 [Prochilodus magdalenae]
MDNAMYRDEDNSWVAPLPFKEPRQQLPNNREQAVTRFSSLKRNLNRKPHMQEQYVAFMEKIFYNGHAEAAPPIKQGEECWFLPTFGVYHPQKRNQIRVVFDSSAQYSGVSLNNVLLTGPDLNNTLIGVLLRFRKESIAIMADIQQMFHCFMVREDHRNFLRFLWHKDNDVNKEVIDYRMKVHVFGNSPSPAVAVYGLRKAIRAGAKDYGADTVKFVERHFYVDDGLISVPSPAEAIDLLKRTQASLAESNLHLHKFASNSQAVMQAFHPEDRAPLVKDLDLGGEGTQSQRSLGLIWETAMDTFTYSVAITNKPFTRRGVLSSINSVFDPLGLLAPVTIQGRALLRELTSECSDWDIPLPEDKQSKWETWRNSFQDLKDLHVPRTYTATSLSQAMHKELCIFSDASTKAIGAVAYLKAIQKDGKVEVGFIMGKAKLAPLSEPTIPRLELCAAVLAEEMADLLQDELDLHCEAVHFYTDSKVVLGYICNESKRFYTYVHNRVQRIRQSSKPEQWHYVRTEENPADHASRSLSAAQLVKSSWFTGPSFIYRCPAEITQVSGMFELIEPDKDSEIRPQVKTYATHLQVLSGKRFERFSSFKSLVGAIANLIHIAKSFHGTDPNSECKGWHKCHLPRTPEEMAQARNVILKETQKACFEKELSALNHGKPIPKQSPLQKLSPVLQNGLISVGGRLKHSEIENFEKSPVILPKDSHISLLLTRHHHELVKHQGRHLTEGAIRAAGFWLIGGKRLVNSVIHKCVICRKLRGKQEQQRMADLPPERLKTCPPFTYVGLDVFGPWAIATRRTRGGQAESKRWAIMFTCMSARAVHIEVIESLDTSSCINALRRFFALRGPAKLLLSDRGTNFAGASKELGMDKAMQRYLTDQGCSWEFNPPHASDMGGFWERMIGVARRILDSMLLQNKVQLTHEVLCTLMAEITAIINARPLLPVSSDPENPFILSPSMLLTQKSCLLPPPGNFLGKDLYTKQWRQVQALADQFWTRWRQEYLPTLQQRQKWTVSRRNLHVGDLVLLKDKQVARNSWPMARVAATFPGKDNREGLYYKILQNGVGGKVYDIIKSMYVNNKCGIKIGNKTTDLFTQGRGVRQGCSLSPTLFNIYINDLAVLLEQSAAPGLTLNHTEVKFLLYADDLVLLSPTERGLQQHLDLLEEYCQNWALIVNPDKSKIMIFQKNARSQESRPMFHLGDTALDHTLSYDYLGLKISASGGFGLAVNALKEKACRALCSIRKQFSKIHIPIRIWLKIFDSVILPIALYEQKHLFGTLENPNQSQTKLNCFLALKQEYRLAGYLLTVRDMKQRRILTKYRLSDHSLALETGRLKQSWLPREDRLPCGLGEPGVALGCLPSDRLMFDRNTTTEESKLLNKHFFDCLNPEPGVPCFFYKDIVPPVFVIEDMVSGRSDKFLGSYTFKVVGGGTSREHPELQRSGSSSV